MTNSITKQDYKYLKLINFKKLYNWSVQNAVINKVSYKNNLKLVKIDSFLQRNKTVVEIKDDEFYNRVTIRLYNKGVTVRDNEQGKNIGTKRQFLVKKGQFILSRIDARNGAFGLIPEECQNAIITNDFWTFDINTKIIAPDFFMLLTSTQEFSAYCQKSSNGTTNRQRISEDSFLRIEIPLPSLTDQQKIVDKYNEKIKLANEQEQRAEQLEKDAEEFLFDELGLKIIEDIKDANFLNFVNFKEIEFWGFDKLKGVGNFKSNKYKLISLNSHPELYCDAFRGKSPKYAENTNAKILNQKCNRWNEIEVKHAKTVEKEWFDKIEPKFLTKEGDILINSTGEGTLGRATYITKEYENLLYDSHLLLLRLNANKVNSLLFTLFFNSKFGQKQIDIIKSAQSTKQTELGIENLKKIKFPILDIEKQSEIANKLIKIKSEIKTLKQQAEENRKQAKDEFEQELFE